LPATQFWMYKRCFFPCPIYHHESPRDAQLPHDHTFRFFLCLQISVQAYAPDMFVLAYNWRFIVLLKFTSGEFHRFIRTLALLCVNRMALNLCFNHRGMCTWKCICSTCAAYQSGWGTQLREPTHLLKLEEYPFFFVYYSTHEVKMELKHVPIFSVLPGLVLNVNVCQLFFSLANFQI
jgi:hypothetical protein